jgi:hypothetical protein
MVAIITLWGGGGCLPTPQGDPVCVHIGGDYSSGLCRGGVGCVGCSVPSRGLFSRWLELARWSGRRGNWGRNYGGGLLQYVSGRVLSGVAHR